jgi:hypothetical protein
MSKGNETSLAGREALELLARFLQEPMYDLDMDHEISLSAARDAISFALAARPPMGISAEWVLGYLTTDAPEDSREAIRNAFTEYAALSGGRQPVDVGFGPEVINVGERLANLADTIMGLTQFNVLSCPASSIHAFAHEIRELSKHTAPPAHAVDLEQFREMAQHWADNAHLATSPMTARACSQQLMALIDSKAVDND